MTSGCKRIPRRRILSIDGGGIKGTVPAAFLAELEQDLDRPIGEYFDLIVGTSTGGILALGLALGFSAQSILELYENRGPVIFGNSNTSLVQKLWAGGRHILKPKHDANILRSELEMVFGDAKISDAKCRLVIPAWDADQRSVYLYKTAHHTRLTTDHHKPILDAALATSAAPTYFKRHRTIDDVGLLDGGIWANNPIAIAVIEAISLLGWSATDLRVLSLGCTDEVYSIPEAPGLGGLGRKLINLFMDGQSRGALGMAKLLTNHPHNGERIFRISPQVPINLFSLDDASKIGRLKGLGAGSARSEKPQLKQVFFDSPVETFRPKYSEVGGTS